MTAPAVRVDVPADASGKARGWAPWALDSARAQLAGWAVIGLANAIAIAVLRPWPAGGIAARCWHHLYDAGQLLAVGLTAHGLVRLWQRWGPRRQVWAYVALFAASVTVALATVPEDAVGFIADREQAESRLPWAVILSVALASTVPAAALAAHRLARGWRRPIAAVIAVAVAAANQLVLPYSYSSVHLFASWAASNLLAGSLWSTSFLRLPAVFSRSSARRIVHGALALAAVASIAVPPKPAVWRELNAMPGAVLARTIGRFLRPRNTALPPPELAGSPWFQSRSRLPAVPASERRVTPDGAIVLLITIDAMRADVLQGTFERTLPTLHAMQSASVNFTMARAPSPGTMTSMYAVFTGKYYSQTYWTPLERGRFKGHLMPHHDRSARLPTLLDEAGIKTVHVVGTRGLASDAGVTIGFREEIRHDATRPTASEVTDSAIARMKRAGPNDRTFLYMHYIEAHAPYDRGGKRGTAFDRYLKELGNVDRELGRLRRSLRDSGLEDRTIFIVTADHGEAFGEHNTQFHSVTLYEELLRIPLFILAPGVQPTGVPTPVGLIDLSPTILDLMGLRTPGSAMGQSLVPFLRGESPRLTRPIAAESATRLVSMVFDDGFKIIYDIRHGTTELFDLRSDPRELVNLIDAVGPRATFYSGAVRAFFDANAYREGGYVPPWRPF